MVHPSTTIPTNLPSAPNRIRNFPYPPLLPPFLIALCISPALFFISTALFCISTAFFFPQAIGQEPWSLRPTPSVSSLRGLSPVDQNTAWVCGSQTALFRTLDRGRTWTSHPIPELQPSPSDAKTVELRSIHAFSQSTLIVATAGTPCRIYRTDDAGISWTRTFEHPSPDAFIDGLRFWNDSQGLAFGDPVDNQLMVLRTEDQGLTWKQSNSPSLNIEPGTAGFAASNSSLLVAHSSNQLYAWIGLGGREGPATVLFSIDSGNTFARRLVDLIPSHTSAGIFSLDIGPDGTIIAVGGDYKKPDLPNGNVAIFDPKSQQWRSPQQSPPRGFRSCVTYLPKPITIDSNSGTNSSAAHWITVGPSGGEWSSNGDHWIPFSDQPLHSAQKASDGSLWACGPNGIVAVLKSQDATQTP